MRLLLALVFAAAVSAADRPNILWIVFEDLSPELGAYGDPYAVTPNLDRFAAESVLYAKAFSNGGACAPARSTLITGMYPPAIGTMHMRSSGRPPDFVRAFPEYLREAGYYASNHSKLDYNWDAPDSIWDAVSGDWRSDGWTKRGDKPFFTVVNITDTHSSQTYHPWVDWQGRRDALRPEQRHDPAEAVVPPYYPDTPETREILKRYADNVTFADRKVGDILAKLEADGLADDTIVFFYSDHGTGLPRSKSFQFESSTRVPLMIRFPQKYADLAPAGPGGRVSRLVAFIDFPATVLSLAGIPIPKHFQGTPFLGEAASFPPQYVYGYRDRMDERYEFIRSVRDGRFKYIRNYYPHRAWFREQTRLYPSTNPLLRVWHELAYAGKLTGPPAIYMTAAKPREQVFDLREDPHELNDLSGDARYAGVLGKLRKAYRDWVFEIRDTGFLPEEEMWLRFDGRAWEAARDPAKYPLERIYETADWVGLPQRTAAQIERLADSDPTVRFWAATGLVAQGSRASDAKPALRTALQDESVAVRTAAAEALCGLGECDEALKVLLAALNHDQEYAALRAANALDHLDDRARPVLAELQTFTQSTAPLGRREFFGKAPFTHWVLRAAIAELEHGDKPGLGGLR